MRYVLKIDIDRKRKINKLARNIVGRLKVLKETATISVADVRVFETRRGYHIELEIDAPVLDNKDIVFMQLLLNSDWRREVFNWLRSRASDTLPNWNILFDAKVKDDGIVFRGKTSDAIKLESTIKELINADTKGDTNDAEK